MADIYKTIAASGADYTSLALAEASIGASDSNNYTFEYIEALSDTTACAFLASLFAGTVVVNVASAYQAKGAVSGAHAELNISTSGAAISLSFAMPFVTVNDLRIMRTGSTNASSNTVSFVAGASSSCKLNRCTVVTRGRGSGGGYGINAVGLGTVLQLFNCFVIESGRSGSTFAMCVAVTIASKIYHTSFFLADGACHSIFRTVNAGGNADVRNSFALAASGTTVTNGEWRADSGGAFVAACDANGSTGANSPGTNTNNSLTVADIYTTLTVGSEDLHYKTRTGMLALNEGSDLSATVGANDIDCVVRNQWFPGADYAFAVPTLSSVSPDNGPAAGGTSVTLTGTNFTDVTGVTFGGDAATNVSVVSDTSITCDTPAHAAGAVSVLATNADGSNTANSLYTYVAAVVTGVSSAVRLRFSDLGFGRR